MQPVRRRTAGGGRPALATGVFLLVASLALLVSPPGTLDRPETGTGVGMRLGRQDLQLLSPADWLRVPRAGWSWSCPPGRSVRLPLAPRPDGAEETGPAGRERAGDGPSPGPAPAAPATLCRCS